MTVLKIVMNGLIREYGYDSMSTLISPLGHVTAPIKGTIGIQ